MRYSLNPTTEAGQTRHTNRTIRSAGRYVRTLVRSLAVFATAVQTGQKLFEAWNWLYTTGLVW